MATFGEFPFYRVASSIISTDLNMIIHIRDEQVTIEMPNLPPIHLNKQYYPAEYEQYRKLYESAPLFVKKCI